MKKTFTYLIAAVAFMLISTGAMAQGGESPYVGSTHDYTVTPGNLANGLAWTVSPGTGYTVISGATSATIRITWTAAGIYTLTLTETDGNSCSTVKELTVTVSSSFEVSTSDPAVVCNTANDTVTPANNITIVDFVVDMTTGVTTWSPNWEVTFTLAAGTGSPTIGTVTSADGTVNDNGGGSYTLSPISSASGTGSATISVQVIGDAFTAMTAVLTITAAKELDYNTTDSDSGDWGATATINPIPNTSAISTD